jgi:hypothetical protein
MPESLTRRTLLTATGAICLVGSGLVAHAAQQPIQGTVDLEDLRDPENNLQAYIKLRGNLMPEPVWEMITGRVFGLVNEEKPRSLFKTFGASRTVYRRVSALEYMAESRYVGLFLDPDTGQLLKHWVNPYNMLECEIPSTRYDMAPKIHPAGTSFGITDEIPSPGVRPWFVIGDVFHMGDQIISPASPDKQPDADLMTFSASVAHMADPAVTSAPSRLSFSAVEHWRDWMRMEQAGSLWWHVSGAKVDGPAAFPVAMKSIVEKESPGLFTEE